MSASVESLRQMRSELIGALRAVDGKLATLVPDPSEPGPRKTIDPRRYGRALANARKVAGMSQHNLANAVGVSQANIGQVETGKHVPRPPLRRKIDEALGLLPGVLEWE